MPLSPDDHQYIKTIFGNVDLAQKGYLTIEQVSQFLEQINIDLDSDFISIMSRGLTLNGKLKVTESMAGNFYMILKDEDLLGILKVGFRGCDSDQDSLISIEDSLYLVKVLGQNATAQDIDRAKKCILKSQADEVKGYSFSVLAKGILQLAIPIDADPYSGVYNQSTCCYLI